MFELAIFAILLALFFDFINGFHDAANSIATVIGTRVLKPLHAVSLAAAANFLGPFIFGVAVATTIGKGIINPDFVTMEIILGALVGAIVWDLITWFWGLPSSSSHALIGGIIGAGIAGVGTLAISLGTFFGGWRIVKTMAVKITQLKPYQGFAAETGGATVLAVLAWAGIPASTTHAISGAIMGAGSVRRMSAVRWGIGKRIVWAWIITIPASAAVGYAITILIKLIS